MVDNETDHALGRRLKAAAESAGLTVEEIAELCGVSVQGVYKWYRTGQVASKHWQILASKLDVDVDFFFGLGKARLVTPMRKKSLLSPSELYLHRQNNFVIPQLDVSASMGDGAYPADHIDPVRFITVKLPELRRQVSFSEPRNLNIITGLGDSMEPTYKDGDILLIDTGVKVAELDAIYVIVLNGKLYIKTLQRQPDNTMLMISDNAKYKPYTIRESDEVEICGRVLLAWNARRL